MKNAWRALVVASLLLPATYAIAHGASRTPNSEKTAETQQNRQSTSSPAEGEKRFHEHCGRCHNPPEDLSPREAKAVIRKMGVRAMLTSEDEKLILQYIAP